MSWSIKYGDKYDFYKAVSDKGEVSPLDELPVLDVVESIYYADFRLLGSERNSGMGISPIPITRITEYANQEGVHNIELFKRIISRIDQSYCKMISDDQEKKSKAKNVKKR